MKCKRFPWKAAAEARAYCYHVHGELQVTEDGWLVWY